jgi:hypothetical protein
MPDDVVRIAQVAAKHMQTSLLLDLFVVFCDDARAVSIRRVWLYMRSTGPDFQE